MMQSQLESKQTDQEGRSRRDNIRIYNVPEDIEKNSFNDYVEQLLRVTLDFPPDTDLHVEREPIRHYHNLGKTRDQDRNERRSDPEGMGEKKISLWANKEFMMITIIRLWLWMSLPSWKEAVISIVPKYIKDQLQCGPLSVLIVNYRLFTLIMARRMKEFLSNLINQDQSGFICQHQTQDNIRHTLHVMNHIRKKLIKSNDSKFRC